MSDAPYNPYIRIGNSLVLDILDGSVSLPNYNNGQPANGGLLATSNTIRSGQGAPTNATVGRVGDFYIDTVALKIYGAAVLSGDGVDLDWGVGVPIQGAQGIQGVAGKDGVAIYAGIDAGFF